MPTLRGMRRRGYPAEAIREFCRRIGVAKTNSGIDIELLEYVVRDDLNETARVGWRSCDRSKLVIIDANYPEGTVEYGGR